MGTFGTGPFDSDGAQDLVDQLADQPANSRANEVGRMLSLVLREPAALMRDVFPDEVVACAALVAASLPNGQHLRHPAAAALPEPAVDLVPLAHQALLAIAGPDGPWLQGWVNETDANDAQRTIDSLAAILATTTPGI